MSNEGPEQEGLRRASSLVFTLVGASLALLIIVVCAAKLRPWLVDDPRPALVRALGISHIALSPPARPPRIETPPSVGLSFSPALRLMRDRPEAVSSP